MSIRRMIERQFKPPSTTQPSQPSNFIICTTPYISSPPNRLPPDACSGRGWCHCELGDLLGYFRPVDEHSARTNHAPVEISVMQSENVQDQCPQELTLGPSWVQSLPILYGSTCLLRFNPRAMRRASFSVNLGYPCSPKSLSLSPCQSWGMCQRL